MVPMSLLTTSSNAEQIATSSVHLISLQLLVGRAECACVCVCLKYWPRIPSVATSHHDGSVLICILLFGYLTQKKVASDLERQDLQVIGAPKQ